MSESRKKAHLGEPIPQERCTACTWIPHVVACVAAFLPPNEVAGTLRLVNKATAEQLKNRVAIRLSQPTPPHVFRQRWGAPGAMRSLTFKQRNRLLYLTAASGSIANLELALEHAGVQLDEAVIEAAARAGHVHVCEALLRRGCHPPATLTAAVQSGSRAMCEWVLLQCGNNDLSDEAWHGACAAAAAGQVELLFWLLMQLFPILGRFNMELLLAEAVKGCELTMVQRVFLDWHRREAALAAQGTRSGLPAPQPELSSLLKQEMLAAAAASPTPDWRAKMEWLEALGAARGAQPAEAVAAAAAALPNAHERLEWLRQRGYPFSFQAALAAARGGCTAAVELMLDAGMAVPVMLLAIEAAAGGHLELLRSLHARGGGGGGGGLLAPPEAPRGADTLDVLEAAAEGGHLPVLVWMAEEVGADVTDEVVAVAAARSGSAELLAWLHERGCAWDEECVDAAAAAGCEAALEFLLEHGCPVQQEEGWPYVSAVSNVDLATLACLRRLGVPWCPEGGTFTECVEAAMANPRVLRALRWLLDAGCPVDWDVAMEVTTEGLGGRLLARLQVRTWLMAQRRQRQRQGAERRGGR